MTSGQQGSTEAPGDSVARGRITVGEGGGGTHQNCRRTRTNGRSPQPQRARSAVPGGGHPLWWEHTTAPPPQPAACKPVRALCSVQNFTWLVSDTSVTCIRLALGSRKIFSDLTLEPTTLTFICCVFETEYASREVQPHERRGHLSGTLQQRRLLAPGIWPRRFGGCTICGGSCCCGGVAICLGCHSRGGCRSSICGHAVLIQINTVPAKSPPVWLRNTVQPEQPSVSRARSLSEDAADVDRRYVVQRGRQHPLITRSHSAKRTRSIALLSVQMLQSR